MTSTQPPPLIRPAEFARLLGISTATLARMSASGRAPMPIRVSTRRLGYRRDEVDAFLTRTTASTA
ncbi:helix-turn-helix transcriptional regulator [Methylobacterium symbioticum]|uniref:Helix-turn-helix domain-containing protein n=1 Tax=Methylobacterium symbioticum TaxID=2584084 RepID=A0A509E8N4_9HYPH|nr:helix-turn-helix domain-containing protein [Methylobacterium symbioticum]VUD70024.1 hypothetical protein MET9862_00585 [Methylobacterium symbioticum]